MKTRITAISALILAGVLPAAAQAEFSANIAATSNYVWRGATQTDDGAAIQGGIDYAHDSGFYLGTWASNVDFGGGGEAEWDLYGGYAGEAGDLGYDVGLIYYAYPDSDDVNFLELTGSLSYGMFSGGLAYTIDGEADEGPFTDGDIYGWLGVSFDLAETWSAGLTVGHYWFDDDGDACCGDLDYSHVQGDITKSAGDWGDFTFSVSYADEEANGGDDDPKVFISWAKSFE